MDTSCTSLVLTLALTSLGAIISTPLIAMVTDASGKGGRFCARVCRGKNPSCHTLLLYTSSFLSILEEYKHQCLARNRMQDISSLVHFKRIL